MYSELVPQRTAEWEARAIVARVRFSGRGDVLTLSQCGLDTVMAQSGPVGTEGTRLLVVVGFRSTLATIQLL